MFTGIMSAIKFMTPQSPKDFAMMAEGAGLSEVAKMLYKKLKEPKAVKADVDKKETK